MSPYLPPVFRGRIATTSGRLLLAAAVMLLLDAPLIAFFGVGGILFHVAQVVVVIAVLLFSARRWIAALLLLGLSLAAFCYHGLPSDGVGMVVAVFCILPPWVGTFVAYPRPRKRWVYVEVEDED